MRRTTTVPAILASLLLSPAPQAADDKIETLIVSANRLEQRSPALNSLSVISGDEINHVASTHINELLNRAPGVWVSRGNGQEHLTAIRSGVLTGPGSCGAFYMAEDGIPLRAPGFCNVNQLFDANTEQAARIEVIRGPGTAVHGSNALNGVINVISRAPTETPSTRINLEGGPHDYSRVKLQHSQGNASHRIGINANGAHDGGYKDDSGFDQQKLQARYDYSGSVWSAQSLLSASNLNQETAGFVQGLDAYKVSSLKKSNPNPEAYRDSSSARFYSRWEREGSQNTHFVVTPYLRYTDMAFLQHFLPGTPLEENGQKSAGLQTIFFSDVGEHTRLHNGFDIDYTEAYLRETQKGPSTSAFPGGPVIFPTGKHYDFEVDALNTAWFAGGEWNPKPERELTAGVRYEIQRYAYDNKMLDGNTAANGVPCPGSCRFSRPADDTNSFYNWSGYIGAREDLSDNVAAVLHVSHGFRAPQASEMYRLQASQLDVNLDSEEVRNYEAGLRGNWTQFNAAITIYRLAKNNIILQNSNRENFSGGKTLRRGLELELDWRILENVSLGFQGSYSKTQFDNNVLGVEGNEVDTAPRQMASAQLRWQPFSKTNTELEWVHVGEHFINATNTAVYPGHNLLNLRVAQEITPQLSVSLRVINLSDEDYAERADFAFGNFRYFIGEPRSAYVGISAEF
ncbi:MAG TPA: TonB-dependent receptor [Spongiibacteraceae bacterium]|nr:TonB-dependent receptor [Spongiibacteraceae bacterium]HCS26959.1 TonB-dependent receptor [Spongiibacteraceae bacterium]